MKNNIALIGMSGTFKTSVAKALGKMLEKRSVDTDEMIEYEYSISIKQLFEKMGEEYFRHAEEKTTCAIADFYDVVISTGGGTVLSQRSMNALKNTCNIIWLTATPDTIYQRLKDDTHRPLLNPVTQSTILKYYLNRADCYRQWADYTVATDNKTVEQNATEIKNLLSSNL